MLGVSVIIYTMVRLMPSDYVDTKYAQQLQTGSITQDDIDRFKESYGINMPDAFVYLSLDMDGETVRFARSVKRAAYADLEEGLAVVRDAETDTARQNAMAGLDGTVKGFVAGNYRYQNYVLQLTDNGTASLQYKEDVDGKTVTSTRGTGTYDASFDGQLHLSVSVSLAAGKTLAGNAVDYKVASGWDKFVSILKGYFTWIGNLLKGDLGMSFKYEKPVAQVIGENMWISFAIALVATILQFLIAIPLGVSSATHQYSARDYIVTVFTMIGLSLPTYFFAAIAIKVFAVDLGWLPSSGLLSASANYTNDFAGQMHKFGDIVQHMILPIFVSVILSLGGLMRYTRTNTLEVLGADYIRTARAKGLSEKKVIYKHAFRNTLIPLATLLAGILPSLFGGMMITEQVFGIDGIGRLAYQALKEGDVPFVMGYNMFLAILTVIGTLLSDLMYSIVDPRVSLGK